MQSPLAPTLRYALLKLDQAAINTTSAMIEMLKFQLPPYTSTPTPFPVTVDSSFLPDIPSASSFGSDDDVQFSQILSQVDALSIALSSVEPQWREWGHSLTAQVDTLSSYYEQRFSSSLDTQLHQFNLQLAESSELLLQSSAELAGLREHNLELTSEISRLRTAPVVPASPSDFPPPQRDTVVPSALFASPAPAGPSYSSISYDLVARPRNTMQYVPSSNYGAPLLPQDASNGYHAPPRSHGPRAS